MKSRRLINSLWLLAVAMFVFWFIFGHRYTFVYNQGESMLPTIEDGEWLTVEKRRHLPKGWIPDTYDIVIIEDRGYKENLCKRIIGTPGDKIEIKDGHIFLNKRKLKDPFGEGRVRYFLTDDNGNDLHYWDTKDKVIEYISQKQVTIPKGFVWVIGDDRANSWFGQLPIEDIKYLVIF